MLKSIGYRIQTLIILLWVVVATVVIATVVIIISFFSRTGNGPHLLARFWANSILWVSRMKVTVSGAEKLDPDRSYIYMPNHQSNADIPLLVDHLVSKFNRLQGKDIVGMSMEAITCLMDHDFPGNVRELENAIEHAFVLCNREQVQPLDLPVEIRMAENFNACSTPYAALGNLTAKRKKLSKSELL